MTTTTTAASAWRSSDTSVKGRTAEEILKEKGLDWEVEKRMSQCPSALTPGKSFDVPGAFHVAKVGKDEILGQVGRYYVPMQNKSILSFMDAVVGEKGAIYTDAGQLLGGKKVWVAAKAKEVFKVGKDDISELYFLGGNGHDGYTKVFFAGALERISCVNSFVSVQKKAKGRNMYVSLRHSTTLGLKVAEVREALGIVNLGLKVLEEQANRLASVQLTQPQLHAYFKSLGFNPDSTHSKSRQKFEDLNNAFEAGPGAHLSAARGTWWGAFNAVTYWADHLQTFRPTRGSTVPDSKANSVLLGEASALKNKAFDLALAQAK